MGRPKFVERVVIAALSVALIIAVMITAVNIRNVIKLNNEIRSVPQSWVISEQERQILRFQGTLWRIQLAEPLSFSEYQQDRDVMISRVRITSDFLQQNGLTKLGELTLQNQVVELLDDYNTLEGGRLPNPALARELMAVTEEMVDSSRDLSTIHLQRGTQVYESIYRAISTVQSRLIGTVATLIVLSTVLALVVRKTFRNNLAVLYEQVQHRAAELEQSQVELTAANQSIQDRNIELTSTLNLLEQSVQQREALEEAFEELSLPIMPVIKDVLVMPIIGALSAARIETASNRLLHIITTQRSRVVILDITGVPAIDATAAQGLARLNQAVGLVGARLVLVGVTPAAAEELIHSGIDQTTLITRSTLQAGVAWAIQSGHQAVAA